jgi:protein-tyrosine phosphatase
MKILMVCLGNICRSPLAMGILRDKLKNAGVEATVDSAGFEPYHNGDPPDERAQDIARKHHIDISQNRARLFRKEDFDLYDKIYVMDSSIYKDVKYLARNEDDIKKLDYIMNAVNPGSNEIVPDPYYGGLYQFEQVFDMLERACSSIAESLKK